MSAEDPAAVACSICKSEAKELRRANQMVYDTECERCGEYAISSDGKEALTEYALTPVQVSTLSGWVRSQASPPLLDGPDIDKLVKLSPPKAEDKAMALFRHMAKGTAHGQWIEINVNDKALWGVASAGSAQELIFLLDDYAVARLGALKDLEQRAMGGRELFGSVRHLGVERRDARVGLFGRWGGARKHDRKRTKPKSVHHTSVLRSLND